MTLEIISVWVHLLAVMVWIGGMSFLSLVMVPSLRGIAPPALQEEFLRLVARKFRAFAWTSIFLLIGTGLTNLMLIGQWPNLQTAYGRVLTIKLILVGLMVFLTLLHDATAPKGSRVPANVARWVPRAVLILGLVVILFTVFLTRV